MMKNRERGDKSSKDQDLVLYICEVCGILTTVCFRILHNVLGSEFGSVNCAVTFHVMSC